MSSRKQESLDDLEEKSKKIEFIKRMVEQAGNSEYYGTLELKFENGIPIICRKIESFKIP